jgi:energy-converting hydrogenase Eha subunit F
MLDLLLAGVALEALMGINCPLTILEFRLRYGSYLSDKKVSFIGNIIDSILFYNAPMWLFTVIYSSFAVVVVITFIMAPPTRKGHSI